MKNMKNILVSMEYNNEIKYCNIYDDDNLNECESGLLANRK